MQAATRAVRLAGIIIHPLLSNQDVLNGGRFQWACFIAPTQVIMKDSNPLCVSSVVEDIV